MGRYLLRRGGEKEVIPDGGQPKVKTSIDIVFVSCSDIREIDEVQKPSNYLSTL